MVVHWSKEELQILTDNYMKQKEELQRLLPNRSWDVIRKKADWLNLDRPKKWRYWTKLEEDILKNSNSIEEACKLLPKRTKEQIYKKSSKLGVGLNTNWSDEEIEILKHNYHLLNVYELNKLLPKRTIQSIYTKANVLGIHGSLKRKDINDENILDLYLNHKINCTTIAKMLNTHPQSIIYRLNMLNIEIRPYEFYYSGENNPSWKGGITPENAKFRKSPEYKEWRMSVFERDGFTCQVCGDSTGGNLHAHHLYNFSEHEDLRLDVDNGVTICETCHNPSIIGSFHHTYGAKHNTKEQFEEYKLNHQKILDNIELKEII